MSTQKDYRKEGLGQFVVFHFSPGVDLSEMLEKLKPLIDKLPASCSGEMSLFIYFYWSMGADAELVNQGINQFMAEVKPERVEFRDDSPINATNPPRTSQ